MSKEEYVEYAEGMAAGLSVMVVSDNDEIRYEGAEIIAVGLADMYCKLDKNELFYKYTMALVNALSIIATNEDAGTRMEGSGLFMECLAEVGRKIYK
jgi:hypothetical protein